MVSAQLVSRLAGRASLVVEISADLRVEPRIASRAGPGSQLIATSAERHIMVCVEHRPVLATDVARRGTWPDSALRI